MKKALTLSAATLLALTFGTSITPAAHAAGILDADNNQTSYQSNANVSFTTPDTTNPVDPGTDPDSPDTPLPVGPGLLAIDYASDLDFGTHSISSNDQTYYASLDSTYGRDTVAFHDVRPVSATTGLSAGYTITVKEDTDFTNGASTLKGASLNFNNANVVWEGQGTADSTQAPTASSLNLTPGASQTALLAQEGTGFGQWGIKYGASTDAYTGNETGGPISLFVPGSTQKAQGTYSTTLTWTINEVPTN